MLENEAYLENRVKKLNDWLLHHNEMHHMYKQQKQKRDYYVHKLTEMDDVGAKTIKI